MDIQNGKTNNSSNPLDWQHLSVSCNPRVHECAMCIYTLTHLSCQHRTGPLVRTVFQSPAGPGPQRCVSPGSGAGPGHSAACLSDTWAPTSCWSSPQIWREKEKHCYSTRWTWAPKRTVELKHDMELYLTDLLFWLSDVPVLMFCSAGN